MQVCIYDLIETTLNIFTNKGLLDINIFKWLDAKIEDNKIINGSINSYREYNEYSPRLCELEAVKYKWSNISNYHDKDNIISRLSKIFSKFFKIEKVEYSNMSQLYLKVYLRAGIKGKL